MAYWHTVTVPSVAWPVFPCETPLDYITHHPPLSITCPHVHRPSHLTVISIISWTLYILCFFFCSLSRFECIAKGYVCVLTLCSSSCVPFVFIIKSICYWKPLCLWSVAAYSWNKLEINNCPFVIPQMMHISL